MRSWIRYGMRGFASRVGRLTEINAAGASFARMDMTLAVDFAPLMSGLQKDRKDVSRAKQIALPRTRSSLILCRRGWARDRLIVLVCGAGIRRGRGPAGYEMTIRADVAEQLKAARSEARL
jgi:hypothetical protein